MTTLREASDTVEKYRTKFKPLVKDDEVLNNVVVSFKKEAGEDYVYIETLGWTNDGQPASDWFSFPYRLADETPEVIRAWLDERDKELSKR